MEVRSAEGEGLMAAARVQRLLADAAANLERTHPDAEGARQWLNEARELLADGPVFTESDLGGALSALATRLVTEQRKGVTLTKPITLRLIGEVMRDKGARVELPDPAKVQGEALEACAASYGVTRRGTESDGSLRERVLAETGQQHV